LENPNQRATAPSVTSILKGISDDKALVLFSSIAVSSDNERLIPIREMNLSTKQYYSRISGLVKAGLIKRHGGKYSLSLLGKVVYDLHMTLGKTLTYYWKLKAIESVEMSTSSLPNEEKIQLINLLIDNHRIKDILMKPVPVSSRRSESKIQDKESTPVMAQTHSRRISKS
jgi:nanoRNase/pAp phosphatase (c-di-AMP/oligoRNAs hydrolase)